MTIYGTNIPWLGSVSTSSLKVTDLNHPNFNNESFLAHLNQIVEQGKTSDPAVKGSAEQSLLRALDNVSVQQQFASDLAQAALVDPDSVNIEDITIAQAEARIALDITRNVLSRVVQGWRDLINTR